MLKALESGHHDIISYLVDTYELKLPSQKEYQQAHSRALSGNVLEEYITWREKTSLGRQSVTESVQKSIEKVKNLVTQI